LCNEAEDTACILTHVKNKNIHLVWFTKFRENLSNYVQYLMWVTSNHNHHQRTRYMLIKNFSENINKASNSDRNSQEYSNILVGEKKWQTNHEVE